MYHISPCNKYLPPVTIFLPAIGTAHWVCCRRPARFLHGVAAMVRPKKHVTASRQNGSRAAKKKTFTRVPVLDALPYEDDPEGSTMTVDYRPKAKKGYFYEDELRRVAFLHIRGGHPVSGIFYTHIHATPRIPSCRAE